jgi:hypothetical protein
MYTQSHVRRKTIAVSFSRELESMLLQADTPHLSITDDLEIACAKGLELLSGLEEVKDLEHTKSLHEIIVDTNAYLHISSSFFKQWHIDISEDLLDEVDLILLTHKDELRESGLTVITRGSILILLAVAALTNRSI